VTARHALPRTAPWVAAAVAGLAVLLLLLPGAASASSGRPALPTSQPADFVNISATENLAFAPDAVTVVPGALVHLTVTQLADFNHTFVLSPLANYTLPASATNLTQFFDQHVPLVNLSLGPTTGARYYANFSAPPVGDYEFICTIHFANGMVGEMDVGTSTSPSSNSALLALEVGLGVGIAIVLIAAVAVTVRRRRRAAGPPSSPPAAPPSAGPPGNP
jgi:plastocyanin